MWARSIEWIALFAVLTWGTHALANDDLDDLPDDMGALGDSMTAAALASFKRQEGQLPWIQVSFVLRMIGFGLSDNYRSIEDRHLSWSTGINNGGRVLSHAGRLAALKGKHAHFPVFNAALSGDAAQDVIDEQLPRLRNWSLATVKKDYPDYVTLLIGANDVCADDVEGMTSVSEFYSRLDLILYELSSKSPKTKILLSKLPNIELLRSKAARATLMGWGEFKRCEDLWKFASLCPTLTTIDDPEQRLEVARRIDDFNLVMSDLTQRLSGFDVPVKVVSKTYREEFSANDLSMDCFHPNAVGQDKLSRATWEESFWGKNWNILRDIEIKRGYREQKKCFARDAKGTLREISCPVDRRNQPALARANEHR